MITVDSRSYVDSGTAFERANQDAARCHETLRSRLMSTGGMAGDASLAEDFAAAYDEAAASALDAVGDLVDAFATCGRITTASLDNHGRAENRSVISGRTVYEGGLCVSGYVSVLPCTLPTVLGGDFSGIPSWAAWILDQVEGFVWPDADCSRLRDAASAWRAAAASLVDLTPYCSTAVGAFSVLRSPEVPVAIEVTRSLASRTSAVADQCRALAAACDDYADRVEEHREQILDLVKDLLRDAAIIQGVGIVLGAFTVGTSAAGAAALNGARIAAAAPRLLRIISSLRAAASTCAAPLRLAASSLRDLRTELAVFRRARVTLASSYDAERLARVARLREIVRHPGLFDPHDLRGLSPKQIEKMLDDWPTKPSKTGEGIVYTDPLHKDRQIRVMDGYLDGNRPDPLTHGPYAVVSQNGSKTKIPLEGNPIL